MAALRPDDRAIVVGIDHYERLGPGRSLRGAVRDAERFAHWLTSVRGGGMDPANVHLYVEPFPPKRPGPRWPTDLEDRIADWLDDVTLSAAAGSPTPRWRRLYLFFSGHGITPGAQYPGEVALLLPQARPGLYDRNVPGRLLTTAMKTWGQFEEVVLFMDCCRDLDLRCPAPTLGLASKITPTPHAPPTRYFVGLATQFDTKTREVEVELPGAAGSKTWVGAFTHALLEALEGAAEQGGIDHNEISNVVRERTVELLQAKSGTETPDFDATAGARLWFVDHVPAAPAGLRVEVIANITGEAVLRSGRWENGGFPELDRGPVAEGLVALLRTREFGLHTVEVVDATGTVVWTTHVAVSGEVTRVSF